MTRLRVGDAENLQKIKQYLPWSAKISHSNKIRHSRPSRMANRLQAVCAVSKICRLAQRPGITSEYSNISDINHFTRKGPRYAQGRRT